MDLALVAAIDFGTTYSGWAFSFKHDFDKDPTAVSMKTWIGGNLVSQKVPTCILIKEDGKTMDTFGFEAENKYADLVDEGTHTQWFYFKQFKMSLFNSIGIDRDILLEDSTGKKLPAKLVFALSIKFLKDDLLEMCRKRIGSVIGEENIRWALTVPAIWNDAAKHFMREAAQEAGIAGEKLVICLEPEAAAIYCRLLPAERLRGDDKHTLASPDVGRKYFVVDAGGGTVDVVGHNIMKGGRLNELHQPTGGDWGGNQVNAAFEKFLIDIIGQGVFAKFKEKHVDDFLDLFRNFEIKKRETSPTNETNTTLHIHLSLIELVKEVTGKTLGECLMDSKYKDLCKITGDKIRIDAKIMQSFFDTPIQCIVDHVKMLLKKPFLSACSAILLVGGFSDSLLLQNAIKKQFRNLKIIIPDDAGLAVLKGAVIFGHKPEVIAERQCKLTYGEATAHLTSLDCNHTNGRKAFNKDGDMVCDDLFEIKVRIGQNIKIGEETKEHYVYPLNDDQEEIKLEIYSSTNPNPTFVTEPGCERVGCFKVPIPDISLGTKRKFGISYIFGGTEIQVKVVDKTTGKETVGTVDFFG